MLRIRHAKRLGKGSLAPLVALTVLLAAYSPAQVRTGTANQSSQQTPSRDIRGTEDPSNRITTLEVKDGQIVQRTVEEFTPQDVTDSTSFNPRSKRPADAGRAVQEEEQPEKKIHPLLMSELTQWRNGTAPDEFRQVLINFRDRLSIPRFPAPVTDESRDSAANADAAARTEHLIQEIQELRAHDYKKITKELQKTRYRGKVLDTFWLINAVLVDLPLSSIPEVVALKDVLSIEPSLGGEPPPQNTNTADDVDDGRARIASDPYFNLGYRGGFIGLLDTGMRFTHTLFNAPSFIGFRRDCVNGGADCNTTTNPGFNPNDDCWNHGTSSGAIISGNANRGNAYRGVTEITLDSWKVYPNACGGLDANATVRAFQAAVTALDRVIVAEIQATGSDVSTISTAADNAFDAGAVVIAANGNNGPAASTVNSPANAHKVIGVGAVDVQTLALVNVQSRGPAPDGRIKPDIQAPTNTETASNASDTALQVFVNTSGAAPYAGGAAGLLRERLRGANSSIDPGQVYAHLILSGRQVAFDNNNGVGLIQLPPVNGTEWFGRVSVTNGATVDVPLSILAGGSPNTLNGALWWPETAAQTHNDIDLYLVDPSGVERAFSESGASVFERAQVAGTITTGAWKLRIRGFSVTGTQTVYWAAHVRR